MVRVVYADDKVSHEDDQFWTLQGIVSKPPGWESIETGNRYLIRKINSLRNYWVVVENPSFLVCPEHGGDSFETSYGPQGNAVIGFEVTFKGKTAHAAGAPWEGVSALDAVELMNVAVNYLREHLHITSRIHYIITEGGVAPNIVPEKASVYYFVRDTDDRVEGDYQKILNCAKGAAIATGCEYEVKMVMAMHQKFASKALAQIIQRNIELVGMPNWTQEEIKFAEEVQKSIGKEESGLKREIEPLKAPSDVFIGGASTDVGDVSLVAPTATLLFPVGIPGSPGHHWSIVASSGSSIGHKGLTAGAKVMACTAIDLLTQPEKLLEVRSEFERLSSEHPYRSFLPQDMRPEPDFYKTEMERWSPLMEPHYKEPTIKSQL